MKKHLLLLFCILSGMAHYLQASVTYAQLQTAINQRNGELFEVLLITALGQSNRLCVFQGLVAYSLPNMANGTDLTTRLRFSSCALFSNNPAGCYTNYTVFCDSATCCTNTSADPITARAIDIMVLLAVLTQRYEVLKFLLTACPYATVNIDTITDQWTLLMYAAQQDNLAAAKLLIAYGADITACSNTGLSVIDIAEAGFSQDFINLLIYTEQNKMKPNAVVL